MLSAAETTLKKQCPAAGSSKGTVTSLRNSKQAEAYECVRGFQQKHLFSNCSLAADVTLLTLKSAHPSA